jgi:hypothetical protein
LGQFDDGFFVGVTEEVFANCVAGVLLAELNWTHEKWVTKLEVGGETNETSGQTWFLTLARPATITVKTEATKKQRAKLPSGASNMTTAV